MLCNINGSTSGFGRGIPTNVNGRCHWHERTWKEVVRPIEMGNVCCSLKSEGRLNEDDNRHVIPYKNVQWPLTDRALQKTVSPSMGSSCRAPAWLTSNDQFKLEFQTQGWSDSKTRRLT